MNGRRVLGVVKRLWYMHRHSPAEVFEVFYWSLLDMTMWGLVTIYIERSGVDLPLPVGMLLGAAMLWALLFRTQLGVALAFLYDVWSRNVVTVMASPLKPIEFIAGATLFVLIQLAAVWALLAIIAWALFAFGVFQLGVALIPFVVAVTLFGMAMSLVALAVILLVGHGANVLAWGLAGLYMPLSAVYFPLSVLPGWLQGVANALPLTHTFESMRAVLAGRPAPWGSLAAALTLDMVYLALGFLLARRAFEIHRRRGFVSRYV